jgi:hypothetical protein
MDAVLLVVLLVVPAILLVDAVPLVVDAVPLVVDAVRPLALSIRPSARLGRRVFERLPRPETDQAPTFLNPSGFSVPPRRS